ncbi:MAG: hypothetical protein K2M34_03540 [Alphaproteobacteria bacterium]|nr:hypothetical protein [Alphaproteobacteria bacterium]
MKKELIYTHFPYCMKHLGNHNYIILNRNYKPLGTTDWIEDYASHPSVRQIRLTQKQAKQLSYKGSDDVECVYFFDETPNVLTDKKALSDYLNRLGLLAKLFCDDKK